MGAIKEMSIDPITRIEGHGKISIQLDEEGEVASARFHVTQFRGFEKFCEGRPFWEMPSLTSRICGICSISHSIASAKACDCLLGTEIGEAARELRQLLLAAEVIQSHALHFFYLACPDLLFGARGGKRGIFKLIDEQPNLARVGVSMRRFGQAILRELSGGRIHIDYAVPGGVIGPLSRDGRDRLLGQVDEQIRSAVMAVRLVERLCDCESAGPDGFASFRSMYMGTVNPEGNMEFYDGRLRLISEDGVLLEEFGPSRYSDVIHEQVEDWTLLKSPYYSQRGYPGGMYRVGPLARLNVCTAPGTPLADEAADRFRGRANGGIAHSTLFYHWARMIETLHSLEKVKLLLGNADLSGVDVALISEVQNETGIGIVEAPRGTLIHHYAVEPTGLISKVNLIVATGHNNIAMNRSVAKAANDCVINGGIPESSLPRIEAAIRCYDPCLSCSTHAVGQMPLELEIISAQGRVKGEIRCPQMVTPSR